jgi:Mn2+/Fe2+ NRAMP family transporter
MADKSLVDPPAVTTTAAKTRHASVLTGAAFLMAVSAIGPGFLTQTTQFTAQLGASLAFAILVSAVIDIGAQLNTWRVVCVSRRRGHQIAGAVVPGLGWVVTAVIVGGSFVFNLGNFSGCGLGLETLLGMPPAWGMTLSAAMAVGLFLLPRALAAMDAFAKLLGAGMILLMLYVVFVTAPPLADAARQAVWPEKLDVGAIVTLVGGTIGGYIMFSGAHRLLEGGVAGPEHVAQITWASVQGIVIASVTRTVLFLAVLGVVAAGASIGGERPVFDAFRSGAGALGESLAALVFWAAAITSVVGCSYTAMTFVTAGKNQRAQSLLIAGFVGFSLIATLLLHWTGLPATRLLIAAGTINGILMPIILGVILWAAYRPSLMGEYRHPWWAGALGAAAWLTSVYLAYRAVAAL